MGAQLPQYFPPQWIEKDLFFEVYFRELIGALLDRLHEAKSVQGSTYHRNIVVQPGPLCVPRANRSLDNPSYRLIDFGRGISLGVNISSVEDLEDEVKREQSYARGRRLIPN